MIDDRRPSIEQRADREEFILDYIYGMEGEFTVSILFRGVELPPDLDKLGGLRDHCRAVVLELLGKGEVEVVCLRRGDRSEVYRVVPDV